MSYYFMASIWIRDEEEYQLYLDQAGEMVAMFIGKDLAVELEEKGYEWISEHAAETVSS